jgi:hypothetical protein
MATKNHEERREQVMTAPPPRFTVVPPVTTPSAESPGGRSGMPLFIIERNFAEQLDPDELDYAGIRLVNDDAGIRWVYSFLSADKKKTYCLYEAPSPEAIRDAAARLGIPADVIVPVDQLIPVPS